MEGRKEGGKETQGRKVYVYVERKRGVIIHIYYMHV
jgi:hypothetical protein